MKTTTTAAAVALSGYYKLVFYMGVFFTLIKLFFLFVNIQHTQCPRCPRRFFILVREDLVTKLRHRQAANLYQV